MKKPQWIVRHHQLCQYMYHEISITRREREMGEFTFKDAFYFYFERMSPPTTSLTQNLFPGSLLKSPQWLVVSWSKVSSQELPSGLPLDCRSPRTRVIRCCFLRPYAGIGAAEIWTQHSHGMPLPQAETQFTKPSYKLKGKSLFTEIITQNFLNLENKNIEIHKKIRFAKRFRKIFTRTYYIKIIS